MMNRANIEEMFGTGTAAVRVDLEKGKAMLDSLLEEYGVPGKTCGAYQGYGVVRYLVTPGEKFYFRSLENIRAELELRMCMDGCSITRDGGSVVIDFSMPRKDRGTVGSRSVLFGNYHGDLAHGMGMDVMGNVVGMDLAKAPHLLVAGTTGSGKSVYLNSLICNLALHYNNDMLRFILVDPKGGVEFLPYEKMPHMLHSVITDVDTAIDGLAWCVGEMERRYAMLRELKVRKISEYNVMVLGGDAGYRVPMPYIVIVMDEFADFMADRGSDLESLVKKLAAKSRAVGIHLVLATQTPRKEVVTGILKANLPTRVCFKVADQTDSRVMLDHNGAECLGGYGDMIYRSADGAEQRLQGCYLTDEERSAVVSSAQAIFGTSLPMEHWTPAWTPGMHSLGVAKAILDKFGKEEAIARGVPTYFA